MQAVLMVLTLSVQLDLGIRLLQKLCSNIAGKYMESCQPNVHEAYAEKRHEKAGISKENRPYNSLTKAKTKARVINSGMVRWSSRVQCDKKTERIFGVGGRIMVAALSAYPDERHNKKFSVATRDFLYGFCP